MINVSLFLRLFYSILILSLLRSGLWTSFMVRLNKSFVHYFVQGMSLVGQNNSDCSSACCSDEKRNNAFFTFNAFCMKYGCAFNILVVHGVIIYLKSLQSIVWVRKMFHLMTNYIAVFVYLFPCMSQKNIQNWFCCRRSRIVQRSPCPSVFFLQPEVPLGVWFWPLSYALVWQSFCNTATFIFQRLNMNYAQ